MYDILFRRAHRRFSLCLVAALTLLALGSSPLSAADPPATLTIDANPMTIEAGETANFKVVLTNTSGDPAKDLVLSLTLSGPADKIEAKVIQDETSNTRTDKVRRNGDTIQWKGDMNVDGVLTIGVRVKSSLLAEPGEAATLTLAGQAGPANAESSVSVQFPEPVNHAQVDFSKVIEYQDGDDLILRSEAEVHSRQQVGIVLRLTNNSDKPIYSLLVDTLAMENAEAASLNAEERACKLDVKRAWVSQGRGSTVPLSALGEEHGENAISAFLVKTEPGQTSEARVRGTVIGSPDCVLAGPAAAFLTATGPGR